MKSFLCVLICALTTSVAFSADYGVRVKERIVNLPNDDGKWYLSVIGDPDDVQYKSLRMDFKSGDLRKLRGQVHYCPIEKGTSAYLERYAKNVSSLPTVRLQDHEGVIIYEAAGNKLPITPEGLYGAMANAIMRAQGLEVFAPWRRRPCPSPCPTPRPSPGPSPVPNVDPEPAPLDGGAAPTVEPATGPGVWLYVLFGIFSFLGGGVAGVAVEWKKTYQVE